MKTNDYVKYLTKQLFSILINQKTSEKKCDRKKREKAGFLYRWFGIIPYVLFKNERKKRVNKDCLLLGAPLFTSNGYMFYLK